MGNYSKLWGGLIGSAVGLAAAAGLDMAWATPELVDAAAIILGNVVGTWVAPPNRPAQSVPVAGSTSGA